MSACQALNTLSSNLDIVTAENESQLRLSTYTRTVGTEVTLSCLEGYKLSGQSTVRCQTGGTWDYTTKPSCEKDNSSEGLSEGMKILIGAVVGSILLVVLIVIIIACCFRRKNRRAKSDQEKFYRQLQEEGMPKGHKPGELVQETQYRPPSYATAWPALSHISMVGKREYPFRQPESDSSEKGLRNGWSLWDNNDYFFGKADIPDENKSQNRSDNYFSSAMNIRRYSADNGFPGHLQGKQEVAFDHGRSSPGDGQIGSSVISRPFSNRNYLQNEVRNKILSSDTAIRRGLPRTSFERNLETPEVNHWPDGNDVVVEVKIPSKYLTDRIDTLEPSTDVKRPVMERSDYTNVIDDNRERPRVHQTGSSESQTSKKSQADSKSKDVYQGHWPMRDDIKSLNEFNKRALLHNRDPFLWRPVDTNFGYESWYSAKF